MVSYTDQEMMDGVARAEKMRQRFEKEGMEGLTASAVSSLGMSVFSRVRPENIEAVVIYKRPAGWYSDVVMIGLPAGVPNVIGTPVNMPLATREEAEEEAWGNFSMMMQQAARNSQKAPDPSAPDMRPFELHGMVFEIPGPIVDTSIMAASFMDENERGTLEDAQEKMGRYLTDIMGSDSFDESLWNAADSAAKQKVLACMVVQLGLGAARYRSRSTEIGPGPFH